MPWWKRLLYVGIGSITIGWAICELLGVTHWAKNPVMAVGLAFLWMLWVEDLES